MRQTFHAAIGIIGLSMVILGGCATNWSPAYPDRTEVPETDALPIDGVWKFEALTVQIEKGRMYSLTNSADVHVGSVLARDIRASETPLAFPCRVVGCDRKQKVTTDWLGMIRVLSPRSLEMATRMGRSQDSQEKVYLLELVEVADQLAYERTIIANLEIKEWRDARNCADYALFLEKYSHGPWAQMCRYLIETKACHESYLRVGAEFRATEGDKSMRITNSVVFTIGRERSAVELRLGEPDQELDLGNGLIRCVYNDALYCTGAEQVEFERLGQAWSMEDFSPRALVLLFDGEGLLRAIASDSE